MKKVYLFLVLFTSLGNYIYLPVHLIPEIKWKELGKHISNIVTLKDGERIINSLLLKKDLNNIIIFIIHIRCTIRF